MFYDQPRIGLGGVMSQIAMMHYNDVIVNEQTLTSALIERFNISKKLAKNAINVAKLCGVIEYKNDNIILKNRPKSN